jgi:hypothetical protein
MVLAGIKVTDTTLVRDAIDLSRSSSEPYLFNHVMRSWLFCILLSEGAQPAPDPEFLAVSAVLHNLGLTDRYAAENRFEVDGANAARAFLKDRGISMQQTQVVWDANFIGQRKAMLRCSVQECRFRVRTGIVPFAPMTSIAFRRKVTLCSGFEESVYWSRERFSFLGSNAIRPMQRSATTIRGELANSRGCGHCPKWRPRHANQALCTRGEPYHSPPPRMQGESGTPP